MTLTSKQKQQAYRDRQANDGLVEVRVRVLPSSVHTIKAVETKDRAIAAGPQPQEVASQS